MSIGCNLAVLQLTADDSNKVFIRGATHMKE